MVLTVWQRQKQHLFVSLNSITVIKPSIINAAILGLGTLMNVAANILLYTPLLEYFCNNDLIHSA